MDEQSRPVEPHGGQGTEDTRRNAKDEQGAGVPAEQSAKSRATYLDPRGSESTRELRDTARRRRDAEEKLQQHLMEAKDHVPNEFHEHPGHGYQGHGHAEHGHLGAGHADGPSAQEQPGHADPGSQHQETPPAGQRPGGDPHAGDSAAGEPGAEKR
ncbi:hypothetical protein PV772_21910 [Pseudarthrobacter sp. CC12]|uniref:hypothetical protein n=1 Tax=Pseudarthrobacter sp. CC12 TaxID=3029193 RepID=UPI0032643A24